MNNLKHKVMETKKIKFALLYIGSGRMVKFNTDESKHTDERSAANALIRMALKEDNLPFTWGCLKSYLTEYVFYLNEDSYDDRNDHTLESSTSMLADQLVYCNAPHIIRLSDRTEVSNTFRHSVMVEIEKLLDKAAVYEY